MTFRCLAATFALVLGACNFDLGGGGGSAEHATPPAPVSVGDTDGGVAPPVTGSNGCFFQPCDGAYGTQCGFICPGQ